MKQKLFVALLVSVLCTQAQAVYTSARQATTKPDAWFATDEAKKIATNILSYQSPLSGFPKNIDTAGEPFKGDPKNIDATFDNSAPTDELRYLARMYNATS